MLTALTYAVTGLSLLLLAMAAWYAWRERLLDDRMLVVAALVELGLLVQLVRGLAGLGDIGDGDERATFAAYLVTLPFVPPGTAFLAIKEKSRWAMGAVAVGAFAVAVMTLRLQQIWDGYA
ncbi:MAG TPA: hypothetical protein VES95_13180 [Dermatophilaceae bacterium]|nr:hypothetical protein [Dermatophilaceae bacterium]